MQDHPDSTTSLSQPESNGSQRSRLPAVRVGGVVKRFGSTTALNRIDGPLKVTGTAKYAYEYPVTGVTYVFTVQSTIAKGRIVSLDANAARALPCVLAVLWHENAPRLAPLEDLDLAVLQSDAVVADTLEIARQAVRLVAVQLEMSCRAPLSPVTLFASYGQADCAKRTGFPRRYVPAGYNPVSSPPGIFAD